MKKGAQLGAWVLQSRIGRGGNGEVWRAEGPDGAEVAVKALSLPQRRERLGRFKNEIAFLLREGNAPGVLPLVDSDLTLNPGPPWYAMPLATPIREALGPEPRIETVVEALTAISGTLASLASREVAHRDLKPDNLFLLDEEWVVGDFGLVSYPEADPLTRQGRRLGPIDFMAPEMRLNADSSNPLAADVHALAKTLWVLLLGEQIPLPGPHRHDDPAFALASRLEHPWAVALDSLISRGTRIEPDHRPSMEMFHDELSVLRSREGTKAHHSADRRTMGDRLNRLAEADQARAARASDTEQRLNRASGPPHEVLEEAYTELKTLLPNWVHDRDSGAAVPAYRLMGEASAYWGQRGRVDGFSTERPNTAGKRVRIAVSVGVRLAADGDTLTIAGGVQIEDGVHEPEWLRSVSLDVPLGSSVETRCAEQLREALAAGIGEALTRAEDVLLG